MPRFTFLATLFLAAVLGHAAVHSADWPEFRGPTTQGLVENQKLPLNWTDTDHVVWKTPIDGDGWSSPILVGDRLFLTAAIPNKNDAEKLVLQTVCIDAKGGDIRWVSDVFEQSANVRVHNKNSHASPTPIYHDERLYVHFGPYGTACLDLTGNVIWRNKELVYAPVHGNGGSPALAGDRLVISCDGGDLQFVVALSTKTGEIVWKKDRISDTNRKFSFSTPLVLELDGQTQVISPGTNSVSAFDPKDGREIWKVRYDGYSVIPRPVYGNGLVYVCTGYGRPNLLAIRPDGEGDVTDTHVAWQTNKKVPHTPSLMLVGDELFFVSDDGIASCLDAKTGEQHWQERLGGNYSASPIAVDGRIYFQSEQGEGIVVSASKEFEELARNPLGERTLASYAVGDNALFIRSDKHLYRVQAD